MSHATPAPGSAAGSRRRRGAAPVARCTAITAVLLASLFPFAPTAAAASSVPATGGTGISADTAGVGGTGAWTTLTGPVITESAPAQIGSGTITLTAPAGFEWNPGAGSVATSGSACTGLTVAALTVTATTVTTTAAGPSTGACSIVWSGLQARPIAGTPKASGTVTRGGTAVISGVAAGAAMGSLSEQAGAPAKLAFTAAPTGAAGGTAFATQPAVTVEDQFGNAVTSASSVVALAITGGTGTTGASLTCTGGVTKATTGGAAVFTGCAIDLAGNGYTLTATASGLASAVSPAFSVSVGTAAQAVFQVPPGGGTGGVAWATQPVVRLLDAGGNATTATTSVTLAITNGTGATGATLTCAGGLSKAAVAGVATFSGCAIDTAGAGYTVRATGSGLAAATSTPFGIAVGPAARLVFAAQPGGGVAGAPWAAQPAVNVADAGGNVVPSAAQTVSLAIGANAGGGTLTCPGGTSLAASGGVAAFAGCSIERTGAGYTLTASATGLASASSAAFGISPSAPVALAFSAQPGGGTGGTPWATQPSVRIVDAYGNTVTSSAVTVSLAMSGGTGGATLACTGGTAKAAVSGVAAFAGCNADLAGTGYRLAATAAGLTSATSTTFAIAVGAAAKLAFTVQPGGGTGGAPWGVQPAVRVFDAGGNPVTTSSLSVTLSITSGTGASGAVLACTPSLSVSAVAGVATFAGCRVDKAAAGYTLKASGAGVTAGTSAAFDVRVGAPAKLAFGTQPGGGTAGTAWTTQPAVLVEDAGGNPVPTAANAVTLAIGSGTTGATLACTGGLSRAATAGTASFAGCTLDKAGTAYTLTAAAAGLTGSTSASFRIAAGTATALVVTTQPGGGTGGTAWAVQPSVRLVDAWGNTTTSTASVTLAITAGTGAPGASLACTGGNAKAASSGTATFSGCKIDVAATGYRLTATSPGVTSVVTTAFAVTVGSPAVAVLSVQPGGGTGGTAWAVQPVVQLLDAGGNPTTGTTSVTLAITSGTGSAGAVLTCTGGLSKAAVSGFAAFTGCAIDKAGSGYTLKVTGSGLATATSAPFTVAVGPAAKLLFAAQPGGGVAGTPWTLQPVVAVADAGGNTVGGAADAVTLAIAANPGGGTLACTGGPAASAVAGLAAFGGCSVDKAGTTYTLSASAAGLTPATSAVFKITPGSAASAVFSTQPGGGTGGVAWPVQPVVRILDAYGNVATSATNPVTLVLAGGAAGSALSCTGGQTKAAVSGIAAFSGCKVDLAASGYALTASAAGLTGDTSSAFAVAVGPAAQLAFAAQPGGGAGGMAWTAQPTVGVLDAGGNAVTSSTLAITMSITTGTGTSGAVLACAGGLTSAASAGLAVFTGCAVNKAGAGYTLKATASGVAAGTSNPFSVTVGAPTRLAFTTTPGGIVAGTPFASTQTVAVQDAGGNVVASAADSVTLAISTGTGAPGATLSCTAGLTGTASTGLAAFPGCTVDRVGTGYTLTASAAGLAPATSGAFAVTAAPPAALQFVNQPGGGTGGVVWSSQPSVRIVDAYGNLATGSATVLIGIAPGTGGAGAALSCTNGLSKATTGSIAAFAGCRIDRAAPGYQLVATASGLTPGYSAAFDVVAGPGVAMVFSAQPGGGVAMTAWSSQPSVTIVDAGGNVAAGTNAQISLAVAGGTAGATLTCLGGLTQAAVQGVAAFSGCAIDKAGSGYTLSAAAPGLPTAASGVFAITAGTPTHLAFLAEPGGGTGGLPWTTQPIVALQDAGGNTVTTGGLTVALALTANPAGGTFACNAGLTRLTQAGVATFTGCTIDRAGAGYQLTATLLGGGEADALSTTFNVLTGPPARLVFETSPGGGTGGVAWTVQPVVTVADAGGNATSAATTVTLAVEAGSGTAGATLVCAAGPTRASSSGRAVWTGCTIDRAAAAYQLRATAPGLADGLSAAFDVVAGPAAQLGFAVQPSGGTAGSPWPTQPTVRLLDAGGNLAAGSTPVTLDLVANPGGGTLSCSGGTTAAPAGGVATFTGCWLDRAASGYQLRAAAAGLAPAVSTSFGVVAAAPLRLVVAGSPTGGTGGTAFSAQPLVLVEDAFGNLATSGSVTVTLSISVNPSDGALECNGGTSMATAGGLAAFNGCRIDLVGTAYQLGVRAAGLAGDTSASFDIVAGPPAHLVFALQPSGGPGGGEWSVQPVVAARDAGGNPTVATVPVTLALGANPGSGSLACTTGLVLTTVVGTAAFGGCSVDRAATGYTLLATAPGLTTAASAAFSVTVGPAARLGFAVQPSGGAAGSAWSVQPVVAVEDAGGNLVPGATDTVSLAPSSSAAGALACTGGTAVQAQNGAAAFRGCSWTMIGSGNVVQAVAPGLAPATSAPFTVTVGTPARLRFSTAAAGALGGSPFAVQPVVQVTDAWDNPVTSSPVAVTLSLQENLAGGVLTCNGGPVLTTSGSLAAFSGCAVNRVGQAYRLVAASPGLTPAVSPPFDVVPGPAARIGFLVQPGSGLGGSPLGTQPVVALIDAGGNRTTGTGSVTLTLTPGQGTPAASLSCTGGNAAAPSGGLATFAGCAVNRAGSGYTLTASHAGFAPVVSGSFTVAAGPAAGLVVATSPSSGTGGLPWPVQPVVRVVDRGGNAVSVSAPITLGLAQNPTGAALVCAGGLTVLAAAGVAAFSGCSIARAGAGYQLSATSPGLTSASGGLFAIVSGPASRTAFAVSPGSGPAGAPFAIQPRVTLYDAGGNVAASTAPVTLTIATGTGSAGAVLSCPGGTTRSSAAGVAAFSGCMIDRAGSGFRLLAAGPGLASSLSAPFDVSPPAAVLTLAPSASIVTYPGLVTLRASFAQLGAAKPVAFQASIDGVSWSALTTVTADAGGAATYTLRPTLNRRYRAVFLGDASLAAGASPAVLVTVRQAVTLNPVTGTGYRLARRGTYVTLTAVVRPWATGRPAPLVTFTMYRLVSGSWRKVTSRSVRVGSTGSAVLRYAFSSTGTWSVIAVAGATTMVASSGPSNRSRFRVY